MSCMESGNAFLKFRRLISSVVLKSRCLHDGNNLSVVEREVIPQTTTEINSAGLTHLRLLVVQMANMTQEAAISEC